MLFTGKIRNTYFMAHLKLREANLSPHDDEGNGEFGFTHPWFVVTCTFFFFKDQKVQ